jgi:outer membrane protein assembly factor BamB
LSGGRVYVTTAAPGGDDSLSLRVICLKAGDGAKVWDVEALHRKGSELPSIHTKNSQASPTPIVRDVKIYAHFGHLGTAALDLAGNVLWRQEALKYIPVHGNGGSPALVDGLLVFSCDAASDPFIAALDAATGEVRWRKPREVVAKKTFSFCTPLVIRANHREEVILPGSGYVGSYDPKTGDEFWRARYGEGYSVVPRPVFADGLIFLSSGFDRAVLYAINPEGASGDSTGAHIAWSTPKGAPHTPSTVVVGDELYFISDGGVATCADARTGKVHWSERLPGDFSASPVAAEGRIYFQSEAGVGYVVKAAKTFELLAKNDLRERSLASCAVADSALYVRTQSHIWRIGAAR